MRAFSVVGTTILLLLAHQDSVEANLVVNGGFETVVPIPHQMPTAYGYWGCDEAEMVGPSDGIVPVEGNHMVKFIYTAFGPADTLGCELLLLVDVGPYSDTIQQGAAMAVTSAMFNRVLGDAQTDTMFGIEVRAYVGVPSTFPSQFEHNELALSAVRVVTDGDVLTWESATTSLALPTNTGFLAIRLWAEENVFNDLSGVELDGHYADAVTLTITPEPATILLLSMAALVAIRRRADK